MRREINESFLKIWQNHQVNNNDEKGITGKSGKIKSVKYFKTLTGLRKIFRERERSIE